LTIFTKVRKSEVREGKKRLAIQDGGNERRTTTTYEEGKKVTSFLLCQPGENVSNSSLKGGKGGKLELWREEERSLTLQVRREKGTSLIFKEWKMILTRGGLLPAGKPIVAGWVRKSSD